MIDIKKLKSLFSGLKTAQAKSTGDVLDTTARAAVSAIVKEIVELLPKKYFKGMSKNRARLVSFVAIFTGQLMRQITSFGPFGDNLITDLAQEVADQIMEEYKEDGTDPVKAKADFQQRKTKLMYIAKVFINAGRYARDYNAEDLLLEFNDLMAELPEENQNELIEALSSFDKKQLIDFMTCTTEQKKRFFSHLFTKIPEKKEEPNKIDELKQWFKDTRESIDSTLEKIDVIFADDRIGGHILNRIFNLKAKEETN